MYQEENQNEGIIQEGIEAKTEQEIMGAEADGSTASEAEEEMTAKEQVQPEKQRVAQTLKKKMAPKSKTLNVAGISKQLEKQTNYLIKLENALQPLGKLAKSSDATLRVVKEISTSVRQIEKQILQIQKIIKREKARK